MAERTHLIDLVGYEFYRKLFALAVCVLPLVFYSYVFAIIAFYGVYWISRKAWSILMTTEIEVKGRGVFITGCDTGLGFGFAKHLDELGFTVFAGCLDEKSQGARKLRAECSKRLHVLPIDVTKDNAVKIAYNYVKDNLPKNGLWGIVNNAGMNMFGAVEVTTVSLYERGFDVNLYGSIRINKQFLPLIRKYKGRIVNISSVHGRKYLAGMSNYQTAKHCLESITDSLRLEMRKFGVHVAVVEPGMFGRATSGLSDAMMKRAANEMEEMWNAALPEVQTSYLLNDMMSQLPRPMTGSFNSQSDVIKPVIDVVAHALCSGSPKVSSWLDSDLTFLPGCMMTITDVYC